MSSAGTIVGGIIGIVTGSVTTFIGITLVNRRRAKSIRTVARAEVVSIREKAERYLNGQSNELEMCASTPLLTSIAPEIGFLKEDQAVALRRVITLDMEMRKCKSKDKATQVIDACTLALKELDN
jgi:hypothetical protein